MSQDEYSAMLAEGRVQESSAGGHTSVSRPNDPDAWRPNTEKNRVYVEFDVPEAALRPGGAPEWALVIGPKSIHAKLAAARGQTISEMPEFRNLRLVIQ